MNNPKIIALAQEQAKELPDVNSIFLKFLGRPPTEQENKKSIEFIKQSDNLAKFIQIIICTGEFRNVK